jgi:D-alanyl-D-alanine carboxypeptidase
MEYWYQINGGTLILNSDPKTAPPSTSWIKLQELTETWSQSRELPYGTFCSLFLGNTPQIHCFGKWHPKELNSPLVGSQSKSAEDQGVPQGESFTPDHLVRCASISKVVVALGFLRLVSLGKASLDQDTSTYLGFTLRHPDHPQVPITTRMILSHTSSIRDGSGYSLPLDTPIRAFFDPKSSVWNNGEHFASSTPQASQPSSGAGKSDQTGLGNQTTQTRPGQFFTYSNLGFGLVGTMIEQITGERFDRWIGREILTPLGMTGGFFLWDFDGSQMSRLVPTYRRPDPLGPWVVQNDDPGQYRASSPDLSTYIPGTNATIFSPQGGLRASIHDLINLGKFFIDRDLRKKLQLVDESLVSEMMSPQWTYNPYEPNGETYNGITRCSGLGLFLTTDTLDSLGGDRLLANPGGPNLWGHHGDAYGMVSGFIVNPEKNYLISYILGGTSKNPEEYLGTHSSYSFWEEKIQELLLEDLVCQGVEL